MWFKEAVPALTAIIFNIVISHIFIAIILRSHSYPHTANAKLTSRAASLQVSG